MISAFRLPVRLLPVCPLSVRMATVDISNLRKPYNDVNNAFLETELIKDPFDQFQKWLEQACTTPGLIEPNAMTLATVKADGRPSARMVLLKGFDREGFKFYTNYRSSKALELEVTPHAALVFHWAELSRSVRIEGKVDKLPAENSDSYFAQRPRSSQLAACVSEHQSAPISGRDVLLRREAALEERFRGQTVPRPDFWGGFVVKPDLIEFWQGQTNRMHDRFVFRRKGTSSGPCSHQGENGWIYQRLEP